MSADAALAAHRIDPLPADTLMRRCDPAALGFQTTAEVAPLDHPAGQPRALAALDLALAMPEPGYNVFATGPSGTGRRRILETLLRARAATRPAPPDRAYVFNFDAAERPRAFALPTGH